MKSWYMGRKSHHPAAAGNGNEFAPGNPRDSKLSSAHCRAASTPSVSCKNIKVSNPVNCDRAWLKMFWWFLFLRTLLRMIHFYHLQANNHQNLFVLSHLKPCICIYLKLHEGLEIFCITFSVFVTIHSMKNVATFRTRNIFNLVLYNLSSLETLLFKKGWLNPFLCILHNPLKFK